MVRGTDAAGNQRSISTTFTVDLTAPTATITSAPAALTRSTAARVDFTADEPVTAFCRKDDGAWVACASPLTYDALGDGRHVVGVKVRDRAGNESTVVSRAWTIDTTAPVVTFTTPQNQLLNTRTASIAFSAGEEASFLCRLDDGEAVACASPFEPTGLSDGQHVVRVQAIDAVGLSSAIATYTWSVDTVAPTVTASGTPSTITKETSVEIALAASEAGSTLACKLNGGEWQTCTAPYRQSGLVDGLQRLEVRATDRAGNVGPTTTVTWTVDTVAPDVAITATNGAFSNKTSDTFSVTASESVTYQCRLDSGSWSNCAPPMIVADASEGQHTIAMRATDRAGNVTIATYTWTTDRTAPVVTIPEPDAASNQTTVSMPFSANETSTFECRISGGSWTACTSPASFSGLTEGAKTLSVRATDRAGNVATSSVSWTVDLTPPTASFVTKPNAGSQSSTAQFTFAADETDVAFLCNLDGAGWRACVTPHTINGLASGAHTLQLRAIDFAGNRGPIASYTWGVDATPPVITVTKKPAAVIDTNSTTIEFTIDDATATATCQLDDQVSTACGSPVALVNLANGAHTLRIVARDQAGNEGVATVSWTVDTVGQAVTITSAPTWSQATASVSFTKTAIVASTECRLDGGTWTACASPATVGGLSEGAHTLEIRAKTLSGTYSQPVSATWTTDLTAPKLTLGSYPSGVIPATSADITFSVNETGATVRCSLDGGAASTCSSPYRMANLSNGTHVVTLQAVDRAGNTSAIASVRFDVSVSITLNSDPAPSPQPELGVLADAPIQEVTTGQVFPAQIIATNNGDVSAEGVTVETSLPDGIEVVEVNSDAAAGRRFISRASAGCTVSGRLVRCAFGTVAPKTAKSVSLTLRAKKAMKGLVFGLRAAGANIPLVERQMDPAAERARCAIAGKGTISGSNAGENICGSASNDTIRGNEGDDFISSLAGNDKVFGGGGNDMILAGVGSDAVDGGAGNDVITLDGSGVARGGSGDDTFIVMLDPKPTGKPKFRILDAGKGEKILIRRGRAATNVTFTYNAQRRAVLVDPDGGGKKKPFVFIQVSGSGIDVGAS